MLNGKELAELVNEEMYNADPSRTDYMKSLSDPVSIGKGYNMLNASNVLVFIKSIIYLYMVDLKMLILELTETTLQINLHLLKRIIKTLVYSLSQTLS